MRKLQNTAIPVVLMDVNKIHIKEQKNDENRSYL